MEPLRTQTLLQFPQVTNELISVVNDDRSALVIALRALSTNEKLNTDQIEAIRLWDNRDPLDGTRSVVTAADNIRVQVQEYAEQVFERSRGDQIR